MNFNHVSFEREQITLKQVNEDGTRYYVTPKGSKYPSVTTVLAEHSRQGIMEWRNKIGHAEAQAITQRASSRGTKMHKLCEMYLNNEELSYKTPIEKELFQSLLPYIHNIDNIHCLESRMYSDYLRLAGTVDCIAEYNGKLAVIDFKSSSKLKKKEYISNYFMQCSAYAIMYEELYNIPVNRLVVIIGVEGEEPQLFEEKRDSWVTDLLHYRDLYESRYKTN